MAFSHSKYTDASHSRFNDVGRDSYQTTIHDQSVHIHFSLLGSQRSSRRVRVYLSDNPSRTIYSSEQDQIHNNTSINEIIHTNIPLLGSQQTSHQVPANLPRLIHTPKTYNLPDIVATVDTATGLVDKIMPFLLDRRYSSNSRQDLALELESLHQTLILTKLTVQRYDNTPLGQSLADTITPEVKLCSVTLQELVDSIGSTCLGLSFTSIYGLWWQIWWAMLGADEFASLRKRMSYSRQSLQHLLVTMHSVAWMELGNELREGLTTLRRFHYLNSQRLPSLYHIKLNAVDIMSHLGYIIPIPTLFCSTWKDFDYVVKVYCRDRVGFDYIERGDYEVIRAEDSQTVGPSELASNMEPGMKFEISIVLRQGTAFQDTKEKCPRCSHINVNATIDQGWIHCFKCSGQFQIAEADVINQNEKSPAQEDGHEQGAEADGEYGGEEEIASPAAQSRGIVTNETSTTSKPQRPDSDETREDNDIIKYFRRIHVICMNTGLNSVPVVATEASSSEYDAMMMRRILLASLNIIGVTDCGKEPISWGSFTDNFQAKYQGELVALKRLRDFQGNWQRRENHRKFCRQALLWQALNHPNILPLYGVDFETFLPRVCMVSPWMPNGTLVKHIEALGGPLNTNVGQYLLEIAEGLKYLHSKNIIHGDLKGDNILIDKDRHARLADFDPAGWADVTLATSTSDHAGSVRWMAPELHTSEIFCRTKLSDVYAFACVFVECYTGKPPFYNIRRDAMVIRKVIQGERPERPTADMSRTVSSEQWDLVEVCWKQDPSERPQIVHVVDRIKLMSVAS